MGEMIQEYAGYWVALYCSKIISGQFDVQPFYLPEGARCDILLILFYFFPASLCPLCENEFAQKCPAILFAVQVVSKVNDLLLQY